METLKKDLVEASNLKRGLQSLDDVINVLEETIHEAEQALSDLKTLPPFKPDYKKYHWLIKYDEVEAVIKKLGSWEKADDLIDASSLFEEDELDSSFKKACNILKKYRSREEYSEESTEWSFNESNSMLSSTMLHKKVEDSEQWKKDLFGISFIMKERFYMKRRKAAEIEPEKATFQEGFVELAFKFEPNQDFVYTCDEIETSTNDDIVDLAQMFEQEESKEEDLYEDIDNLFVLLPEKSDRLEEKLELPVNISEFAFNFDADSVETNKPKDFCVNIAKSQKSFTFR